MNIPRSPGAAGEKGTQSSQPGTPGPARLPSLHPTYQLREHLLQLVHIHKRCVLCLGLAHPSDSCL